MHTRDALRKVAVATTYALLILSVSGGLALAKPNSDPGAACRSRGFYWDSTSNRCADKSCDMGGQPGDYKSRRNTRALGGYRFFYCNGFTGQWELVQ